MALPKSRNCRHPDIRVFDGLRCCLSCGFSYAENASTAISASRIEEKDIRATNEYAYRSLNYELGQEIRLIVLLSGNYHEPLRCEIVHANLLDKPKFEALSYTWADEYGDDSIRGEIACVPCRRVIRLTANCENALRRLRLSTKSRTIWVDAVCIDQNNIKERNHQVRQMGSIYASAQQVVIYLGNLAYNTLRKLDEQGSSIMRNTGRITTSTWLHPSRLTVDHPHKTDTPGLSMRKRVYSLYFCRLCICPVGRL